MTEDLELCSTIGNKVIGMQFNGCWDLVVYVYKEIGIKLPKSEDIHEINNLFKLNKKKNNFDMVIMKDKVHHAGVFMNNRIYHIPNKTVRCDDLCFLKSIYSYIRFYIHV